MDNGFSAIALMVVFVALMAALIVTWIRNEPEKKPEAYEANKLLIDLKYDEAADRYESLSGDSRYLYMAAAMYLKDAGYDEHHSWEYTGDNEDAIKDYLDKADAGGKKKIFFPYADDEKITVSVSDNDDTVTDISVEKVEVPDFIGSGKDEATELALGCGLAVKFEYEKSSAENVGKVVGQSLKKNKSVWINTEITLFIGAHEEEVAELNEVAVTETAITTSVTVVNTQDENEGRKIGRETTESYSAVTTAVTEPKKPDNTNTEPPEPEKRKKTTTRKSRKTEKSYDDWLITNDDDSDDYIIRTETTRETTQRQTTVTTSQITETTTSSETEPPETSSETTTTTTPYIDYKDYGENKVVQGNTGNNTGGEGHRGGDGKAEDAENLDDHDGCYGDRDDPEYEDIFSAPGDPWGYLGYMRITAVTDMGGPPVPPPPVHIIPINFPVPLRPMPAI